MTSEQEKIRRLIVKLVFVIYWLLIFEGAMRKWAFPGMQKAIFFIRDPFVLAIYWLALKNELWPRWTPLFKFGIILAIVFIPLAFFQVFINDYNPLVAIYGWRMYFWYVPLVFIIGEQFRGKDLARLFRQTLLAVIPIAVLVLMQFRAPPEAFVNRGTDPEALVMLSAQNKVRTSGTFTIGAAQGIFIGSAIAMVMSIWLMPRAFRPMGNVFLLVCTGAVVACLAVSGSRSAFLHALLCIMAAVASAFLVKRMQARLRAIIRVPLIILAGLLAFVYVFPDAYSVMVERFTGAAAGEGGSHIRLLHTITDVFALSDVSVIGRGLGIGSPGAMALLPPGAGLGMSESELPRIVSEAGIAGIFYIAFRFWLSFSLLSGAIAAARNYSNSMPLLVWSFVGLLLINGGMTFQGTINGYGWLFAGFTMAATRMKKDMQPVEPSRGR